MPEARSGRRVLIFVGSLLTALLLMPWLLLQWITASKWSAMEKRVAFLLKEQSKRDPSRPVLRGAPLPGESWEDYREALGKVGEVDSVLLHQFLHKKKPTDPKAVQRIVDERLPALMLLRRGASRRNARHPHVQGAVSALSSTGTYGDHSAPSFSREFTMLGQLGACQAQFCMTSQPREAMEILLDVAQFGRDVGTNGFAADLINAHLIWRDSFDGLRSLLQSKVLSEGDLHEMARQLEILDRHFPRVGDALLNDSAVSGASLLKGNYLAIGEGLNAAPLRTSWRFGFSSRLLAASEFLRASALLEQAGREAEAPWPGGHMSPHMPATPSKNKLDDPAGDLALHLFLDAYGRSLQFWARESRARLRLLREAVGFLATGQVTPFEDPFGKTLLHRQDGGRLKVWSVGISGVDQGGNGVFSESLPNKTDQFEATHQNLTLEVER